MLVISTERRIQLDTCFYGIYFVNLLFLITQFHVEEISFWQIMVLESKQRMILLLHWMKAAHGTYRWGCGDMEDYDNGVEHCT